MEIERNALVFLQEWKSRTTRKPLIVRGARQVGKTRLIRDIFGKREYKSVVEINFEFRRDMAELFLSNDPAKIVPLLETVVGERIVDGETLLFLDEVQKSPDVILSYTDFTCHVFHKKKD